MPSIQSITLHEDERQQLTGMLRKGKRTPRQLKRAQIVILADTGKDLSHEAIAAQLLCSRHTVRRVLLRFLSGRLGMALGEDKRTGQPRKLRSSDERYLLSLVMGKNPAGYTSWPLPLLQKRLSQHTFARVSTETIRRFLKRHFIAS